VSAAIRRALLLVPGFGLFLTMAGCVAYVQGDDGAAAAEPEMFLFGGYGDGAPARDYSRRGAESRGRAPAAARPAAARPAAARPAAPPRAQPAARPAGRTGGGGRR
jgi:hypothetical protein